MLTVVLLSITREVQRGKRRLATVTSFINPQFQEHLRNPLAFMSLRNYGFNGEIGEASRLLSLSISFK